MATVWISLQEADGSIQMCADASSSVFRGHVRTRHKLLTLSVPYLVELLLILLVLEVRLQGLLLCGEFLQSILQTEAEGIQNC